MPKGVNAAVTHVHAVDVVDVQCWVLVVCIFWLCHVSHSRETQKQKPVMKKNLTISASVFFSSVSARVPKKKSNCLF